MAFHGRVALVTGAASGMGRISAWRLADHGAQVAAIDLDEAGLGETAKDRPNIHPIACDVADLDQVKALVDRVQSDLGAIDRLTHAAAIMPASLLAEMPPDRIHHVMRVNFEGTVNVTLSVLPGMRERRSGDVILFGSLAGYVPQLHMGAYDASKAAVNMFGEVLARECEGSGIRITLVCPPMVDTPLLEQVKEGSNPRAVQLGIEQGRAMNPNIVVDTIEKELERGTRIILPSFEAKTLHRLRRFAPGFLWRIIIKAESRS